MSEPVQLPEKRVNVNRKLSLLSISKHGLMKRLEGGRDVSLWKYTRKGARTHKEGFAIRARGPFGVKFLFLSKETIAAINELAQETEDWITYQILVKVLEPTEDISEEDSDAPK